MSAGAAIDGLDRLTDRDTDGNLYVEVLCPGPTALFILDSPLPEGYTARLRVYVSHAKKAVIDRETDLLTPKEFKENAHAVRAAKLEELKIWVDHECFPGNPDTPPETSLMCAGLASGNMFRRKTTLRKRFALYV